MTSEICDGKTAELHEHTATFRSRRCGDERGSVVLHFRLIRTKDEPLLLDFFHSHTRETIYLRYGMFLPEMTHERALQLVDLDGQRALALVGLVTISGVERIVAIGRYFWDQATDLAEVAFVVHEKYRGMGIASHVLLDIVEIIRKRNFTGMTAQVLSSNWPMLQVLHDVLGRADQMSSGCGEETLTYHFAAATAPSK